MENPRILDHAGSSGVRKAQIIAAVAGALVTAALPIFLNLYGKGRWTFVLMELHGLTLVPASSLCLLFGWDWSQMDGAHGLSWSHTSLAAVTNALLLWLVATAASLLFAAWTKRTGK